MSWNTGPYPPPDPNQTHGGQPGVFGQQPAAVGYPAPPAYPPKEGYPPQDGLSPQGGHPAQEGYPPQKGYPVQDGYPKQGAYPPQAGYPPQQGYPPQGYPSQGGYPPQPGYPPQGGHPPPPPGHGYPPDLFAGSTLPHDSFEGLRATDNGVEGGEDLKETAFDFSDKTIRRGFIRKVYSILMAQLSVSVAFIALFVYHYPTRLFASQHPELVIVAVVVFLVSVIALSCCGELRRKSPTNYILLSVFTLAESFCLGAISTKYQSESVLMAVGITAAVCFALTLFAFQTKWDFTIIGGVLFVALVILIIFGLVAIFVRNKIVSMLYASAGALLFSVYLIYDTQMMMGGNHKYSISPEEYVFAALNLYLDIINIFLYILSIVGKR